MQRNLSHGATERQEIVIILGMCGKFLDDDHVKAERKSKNECKF